ncbi:uncharacterized protein LOC127841952 [Dreissena polymorpha]|uniref:Potassium channel domain-containing protein n=1 Tax=Dreissena polymorpha TaxID=45954 RepID=A0A9D4N1S0_DREPO|nr:uncharacterized protein LOC127841952 [Dreissena polymorpha]KAH3886238.1 hypothetical protein DPMN_010240 [Dreissena polymorpha]
MKKRVKKAKEKVEPVFAQRIGHDNPTDCKDEFKRNKSRSPSRDKRSLSSLFRHAIAGPNDRDVQPLITGAEDIDTSLSDINPRTNPRDHLKRMTVREALLYNRKRGRSPNRRTLKLEKIIFNDEPDFNSSRFTSEPDLRDQTENNNDANDKAEVYAGTGASLPRRKRVRGRSDDAEKRDVRDTTMENNETKVNFSKSLPLDKRKYMISQISGKQLVDKLESKNESKTHLHLHQLETILNMPETVIERRQRESFSQFLQLHERPPMRSRSGTPPIVRQNIQLSRFEPQHVESLLSKQIDKHSNEKDCTPFSLKNSGPTLRDTPKDNNVKSNASGEVRPQRSLYVSPRRFSRRSGPSVSLNESENTICFDNPDQYNSVPNRKSINMPINTKYTRQFSKERNTKDVIKDKKDESTNTDRFFENIMLVNSCTQTYTIEDKKYERVKTCSQCVQTDFAGETNVNSLLFEKNECSEGDLTRLRRDIIIIDQESDVSSIHQTSVESAFKPVKPDKQLKLITFGPTTNNVYIESNEYVPEDAYLCTLTEECNDTKVCVEIDRMVSDKLVGNVKSDKKIKGKSYESGKNKQLHLENNQLVNEEDDGQSFIQQQKNEKIKSKRNHKSKLTIRKTKEKQHKSISAALIKAGRTASLTDILDSHENVKVRKIAGTVSRSLENLEKIPDESLKESLKNQNKHSEASEKHSSKRPPRLSLAAIVTLKSRLSRLRKAKEAKHITKSIDTSERNHQVLRVDNCHKANDDLDFNVAKVYFQNEINSSIGKMSPSNEKIIDVHSDITGIVYESKISFAPFPDDNITEEELIKQRQRNTRLTSRRESKVRQRQKKVINCCKKFVAFLFSHIGLCSLVVAYCILGGIIFQKLEGSSELTKKREMAQMRLNFTERIHRLAFETTVTKGSREQFKSDVNLILKEFSVSVYKQTKEAGWDGKEIVYTENGDNTTEEQPEQWSYPSSMLYAITVMTTIGYGHVAPKTDEGRIMTIAYALLGIPLTLLCLTNIGDLMAHGFRNLYGKVCCGLCCILFKPRRRRRHDPERGMTTQSDRIILQKEGSHTGPIQVPTSVCLLLMTSYIMLGTFLFAYWENWDIVTGTYFCFITLSTIGFGDVVPGVSSSDWDKSEKLVLCALYLILGLSLIAMCFNLVQEDVKAKCKWLGTKLGIIDAPVSSV